LFGNKVSLLYLAGLMGMGWLNAGAFFSLFIFIISASSASASGFPEILPLGAALITGFLTAGRGAIGFRGRLK
jgi:hypothetical protein